MEGRTNPRRSRALVQNPPWVTRVIADHYEFLESKVPSSWLPLLDQVKTVRGRLSGRMKEYGCGAYGCVLPTLEPGVVLKVTTDQSETLFAAQMASTLVVPVSVDYLMAVSVADKHHGSRIAFLWREAAQDVGAIGGKARAAVTKQHQAASRCVLFLKDHPTGGPILGKLVDAWRRELSKMADVPELEFVASGMRRVFDEQGIAFLDVHEGNLGKAIRNGHQEWVITDPGNVVVIEGGAIR